MRTAEQNAHSKRAPWYAQAPARTNVVLRQHLDGRAGVAAGAWADVLAQQAEDVRLHYGVLLLQPELQRVEGIALVATGALHGLQVGLQGEPGAPAQQLPVRTAIPSLQRLGLIARAQSHRGTPQSLLAASQQPACVETCTRLAAGARPWPCSLCFDGCLRFPDSAGPGHCQLGRQHAAAAAGDGATSQAQGLLDPKLAGRVSGPGQHEAGGAGQGGRHAGPAQPED